MGLTFTSFPTVLWSSILTEFERKGFQTYKRRGKEAKAPQVTYSTVMNRLTTTQMKQPFQSTMVCECVHIRARGGWSFTAKRECSPSHVDKFTHTNNSLPVDQNPQLVTALYERCVQLQSVRRVLWVYAHTHTRSSRSHAHTLQQRQQSSHGSNMIWG